ncbi:hypothetical protein ACFUJR_32665 [Streptomyces sp. NPDC057271]|uniref:hypothetical protein n=1 Tax=unclassified Streptomyces TaxID=2593676 RepID=UPI00362B2C53
MTAEQQEDTAGEQRQQRIAAGCLAVIGASFAGTIAIVVPETAYYTAGLLTAAGVRKARLWFAGRRGDVEATDEEQPVDIVAVLQALGDDGGHVLLTRLREAAELPDTKTVRALLDAADIPVRAGVRTPDGNGPGVHQEDIPRESATPSGRCLCRSHANTNANNSGEQGPQKGFRVEAIGQAGAVVHDPADLQRHHAITK